MVSGREVVVLLWRPPVTVPTARSLPTSCLSDLLLPSPYNWGVNTQKAAAIAFLKCEVLGESPCYVFVCLLKISFQ